MKNLLAILFAVASTSALCQSDGVDSLILNAQYDQALARISGLEKSVQGNAYALLAAKKAETLIRMGKYEEAGSVLDAIVATDAMATAIRLSTYGFLYLNQGRYDLAEESLNKAISGFESAGKSESLDAAQAISYLGLVYNASGNHVKAKDQMNRSLAIREKLLPPTHELIGASYNDLGLTYANIDNETALEYYEKALQIYTRIHGKEHPKIAIASSNNGYIYRKMELYGDATNNFETALKIWEKVYPGPHPAKAFALTNLGQTYLMIGNRTVATAYYERALATYKSVYGEKHPDIAQVLNALGNIRLGDGAFDAALQHYQNAIVANTNGFSPNDISSNPDVKEYYNGHVLLYSLVYKAEAFEKRYLNKTLKFQDLRHAINTLQLGDSLIDKLRQHSTNESDKIALGVIASDLYSDGVRIATEAAANAWKKKPYYQLAFYFAEKSKSAVLLESISDANAKSFAGIPSTLMEQENNLKAAIALTTQKLSQKPGTEEEKKLREKSYNLGREYETFTKNLEREYPSYFNLKYNSATPSIEQLQAPLDNKTAILSYFIDEKSSRLYTFLITGKKYKVFERTLPPSFDKYITGMRNSIYFNETKSYILTAGSLGDLLIPRIPASVRSLVLLPTGRLSVIPFEALLTGSSTDKSFAEMPYLINDYSVRYEFSAGLLLQKISQPSKQTSGNILLCAPVNFPLINGLPSLPGTQSEVTEISSLFNKKNINAEVQLFDGASESLLKSKEISSYSVVHLATHGVVDERNPELSRIFLQSGDQQEDGNLFAGEIYNLKFNAQLVTLSACQTGLGKISKGEGVIGLSRALVYAGAKNIIVSYWSVADESTAELMKDFYRILLEKNGDLSDFHVALQSAKKELMQEGKFAAPYYWAPFILIGY
jgi:CHAT domain-containing protein